jgi:hypothetical protein
MKKLIIVGIIVAVCAACGGGSAVDKSISQVEKALAKVEKNKGKMTEADWKALEKEVEEPLKVISEALEKDKVGMVGKMKIIAVTAKWATVLAEAGISELEKRTGVERENFGKELEKAAKEIEKNAGGDLEKLGAELEKAAKELEKIATDSKK